MIHTTRSASKNPEINGNSELGISLLKYSYILKCKLKQQKHRKLENFVK